MKNFHKLNLLFGLILILLSGSICHGDENREKNNNYYQYKTGSGYVEVDNGKLFHQKFGSGTPMIIVHGGPGMNQDYLFPQMLELAKDHELIFYDQRGTGHSLEANIDSKYISFGQFAKDLEKLRSRLGIKKFILVGHGWGGLVSMQYAIDYPKNISSLILMNPMPASYNGLISWIIESFGRINAAFYKIPDNYNEFSKLTLEQINNLHRNLFGLSFKDKNKVKMLTFEKSKESALNYYKLQDFIYKNLLFKPNFNILPNLQKLKIPSLIIHGNYDVIPAYTAQDIADNIQGSEIIYLSDAGEFPYIEAPDELFSSIRSFLGKSNSR